MDIDIKKFDEAATCFYGFCRRMEKSGLPSMPKDDHDMLLSVNLHMQMALAHMKKERRDAN